MKWGWLGLLSGLIGFYILSLFQTALRSAWIGHAVAISFVLIAAAIVTVLRRAELGNRIRIAALNVFIIGIAVAFSLGVLVSIASLLSVTEHAKNAAGDAPFCIQVADSGRGDYKPARTLLDLSGLTMWAEGNGSLRAQHHAILIVGDETAPRLFHWSYRKQEFVAGVINEKTAEYGPALTCIPTRNFIAGLPALFPRAAESQHVRFSKQEAYQIPNMYQPRWSGGQSRTLRLAVTPPEFAPLKTPWDDLPLRERDSNWVFVEWNPAWLLDLMRSTPRGQVVKQGTEFGLQKNLIISYGRDSKKYGSYRYLVYADGQPDRVNTTLIDCSPGSDLFPPSCQHRFLNGGRHFYFRHRPEDVPNWQGMQKHLLDLFASFEIRSTDTPSSR